MNAPQQPETRTTNGDIRSRGSVERPKVRPDHSVLVPGSIREPKEHWISHAVRAVGLGGALSLPQLAAMAAVVFIAREALKADGLNGDQKLLAVSILASMLVILGLATLYTGAKPDGKNREEQPDQSAEFGDG